MYFDSDYSEKLNRYLYIAHIRYYVYQKKIVLFELSKFLHPHLIKFHILPYHCPDIRELIGIERLSLEFRSSIRLNAGYVLKALIHEDQRYLYLSRGRKIVLMQLCVDGKEKYVIKNILSICLKDHLQDDDIRSILDDKKRIIV